MTDPAFLNQRATQSLFNDGATNSANNYTQYQVMCGDCKVTLKNKRNHKACQSQEADYLVEGRDRRPGYPE